MEVSPEHPYEQISAVGLESLWGYLQYLCKEFLDRLFCDVLQEVAEVFEHSNA